MITAKEAYKIAKPAYDNYMAFLDKKIRKAAGERKTEIIIRESPYNDWLYDEKNLKKRDEDAYKAISKLRELGFSVGLYYNELQFVDIGLRINWGNQNE